jgi:uncharacterized protein YyaL (SSP411 family)
VNRLAGAASLYLRQHADNPVDWWPWSDEAFDEAKRRDVPVFLSIGYAACHWCHVMAHECFEDPTIAALVNEYTVAIKVDREERPDVDALYMSATQAMTGRGGWPMTVFLTPQAAPFFAGTYFPPAPRHGQPGFAQVLTSVADVWANRREDLLDQAERLTAAIAAEAALPDTLVPTGPPRTGRVRLDELVAALATKFDAASGGFSAAPKFPHPAWIESCLAHSWATGDPSGSAMATTSLDAMARGGLFDHVGGGFARYSVDAEWHVPHFEKMLSDQALLARAYARAAAWGGDRSTYAAVARRTLDFVLDELRVPDGFASSLDADAGGTEGSHVVLTATEARDALAAAGHATLAARTIERYRLDDDGPVDGRCVPRLAPGAPFEGDVDDEVARRVLLDRRAHLARPGVDDKVLLEWNAMFASVLAEAAWRLDEPRFGREAAALVDSLTRTHRGDGSWLRRSGPSAPLATCGDVAWLLDAHVSLYELDGEWSHLVAATSLVDDLMDGYWDGERPTRANPDLGRGLFQSHRHQTGLLVRAKDVLDGAVPSGSSVAAVALARLAALTGDDAVLAIAERLVALGQPLLDAQPQAAATLVEAACRLDEGTELVVPGAPCEVLAEVRRHAPAWSVLAFGSGPSALFEDRREGFLYRCRASVCEAPLGDVASVAAALGTAVRGEASQ